MKALTGILLLALALFSSCSELDDAFGRGRAASSSKQNSGSGKDFQIKSSPSDLLISRDPITTKYGTYHFLKVGDDLNALARKYGLTFEEMARVNGLTDYQVSSGRRIFFPNANHKESILQAAPQISTAMLKSEAPVSDVVTQQVTSSSPKSKQLDGKLSMIWPVEGGGVVTSRFGPRGRRNHDGIDISAKVGTNILAVADGKIIFAERFAGYGNLIVIMHAGNYFTAYAHASTLYASLGDKVKQGQRISAVGSTGHSTGPHLHFEVRKNITAIDPLTVLPVEPGVKFVNLKSRSSSKKTVHRKKSSRKKSSSNTKKK